MHDEEIQLVFDRLQGLDKLYQLIRLVDPLMKRVVNGPGVLGSQAQVRCYDFWGKGSMCTNCISMRAFNENGSMVKIELSDGRLYLVTAVPYELSDRRVVIELLQDITNNLILEGHQKNTIDNAVYALIESVNNLALKDALTGLYNRRYINEKLPVDIVNTALLDRHLSVIMTDIDFFKKVNDEYGHPAGDFVLQEFASTLVGCLKRNSDWVARAGGEEFLICLPGADRDRAVAIAQLMRTSVAEKLIHWGGLGIKITASFGVYSTKPGGGLRMQDIMQEVDNLLYSAKRRGRNRVEYTLDNGQLA